MLRAFIMDGHNLLNLNFSVTTISLRYYYLHIIAEHVLTRKGMPSNAF
jgi:hypothetical protein